MTVSRKARRATNLSAAFLCIPIAVVAAFSSPAVHFPRCQQSVGPRESCLYGRRTLTEERTFDPLNLSVERPYEQSTRSTPLLKEQAPDDDYLAKMSAAAAVAVAGLTAASEKALAADSFLSMGTMNPSDFQPVCPASDGFYRFLQSTTVAIVGKENFIEYGPLIAGGLLRVRLELCVVESYVNEAVGPFIKVNGLNWVLPLHETVETFLAGTIFAFASTFILIGSTKIVSVVVTYADFILGLPSRLLGGFFYDRASGKAVTLDIGFGPFKTRLIGPPDQNAKVVSFGDASVTQRFVLLISGTVKILGQILGFVREAMDALDVFVGRYLVLWATSYVLIKFVHFKVFPDFP